MWLICLALLFAAFARPKAFRARLNNSIFVYLHLADIPAHEQLQKTSYLSKGLLLSRLRKQEKLKKWEIYAISKTALRDDMAVTLQHLLQADESAGLKNR